ncbi:MAG: hypothetical protein GX639_22510 [Fibrobacter sp.]|nr:hypothetical protein [Fibrobacter sp.]
MYEDIGTLIGKGFDTWKSNLNLAVPSAMTYAAIMLLITAIAGFPLYITKLGLQALVILVGIFAMFIVYSFFTAGTVGMAKVATYGYKATLKDMWVSGRRHYLSLFFVHLVIGLAIISGFIIIFISCNILDLIPGSISSILLSIALAAYVILTALIMVFIILASVVFSIVPLSVVVDGRRAVNSIGAAMQFFLSNKKDVFLIWLVIIAIWIAIWLVSLPFSVSYIGNAIWWAVETVVYVVVVQPLSMVWFTRLYMSRTGKMSETELLEGKEGNVLLR